MKKSVLVGAYVFVLLVSSCGSGRVVEECDGSELNSLEQRYLVVSSGEGYGLVNRLRSIASASVTSALSGRKLIIDWRPAAGEVPAEFNQLFKNKIATPDDITFPVGWQKSDLLNMSKNDPKVIKRYKFGTLPASLEENDIICSKSKIVVVETYYRIKNNGFKFEDHQKEHVEFLRNLEPIDEITQQVERFSRVHFSNVKQLIGVHFRSFAQSNDWAGVKRKSTVEERLNAILIEMEKIASAQPDTQFFVAADSESALETIQQKFGARVLSRGIKPQRKTIEGLVDALVDWYLLGKTDYVVGSLESSFSEEAALLTKKGVKIDVGPSVL